MTQRELAIYTAGYAHKDQMYGESPYLFHLDAVDQVLEDVGYGPGDHIRIAAWLHDTLEDTDITAEYLHKYFGIFVVKIVQEVTNEPGANRKERAEKTYPKIAASIHSTIDLKLADRIANIEQSNKTFSKFGLMYLKEHPYFYKTLHPEPYNLWSMNTTTIKLWNRYKIAITDVLTRIGVHEAL